MKYGLPWPATAFELEFSHSIFKLSLIHPMQLPPFPIYLPFVIIVFFSMWEKVFLKITKCCLCVGKLQLI